MKFLFDAEDCVFGLLVGYVLIGMSGIWYKLPAWPMWLWGIVFAVSLIFTLLDFANTVKELTHHPVLIALAFLNNVVDAVIELAMLAIAFSFTVPVLSPALNPYLTQPLWLMVAGIFIVVSSIFWFIMEMFK